MGGTAAVTLPEEVLCSRSVRTSGLLGDTAMLVLGDTAMLGLETGWRVRREPYNTTGLVGTFTPPNGNGLCERGEGDARNICCK